MKVIERSLVVLPQSATRIAASLEAAANTVAEQGKSFAGEVAACASSLQDDVKGIAVVVGKAEDEGLRKCARSWRYTADVGSDPAFPDVSARDAAVLRELKALGRL